MFVSLGAAVLLVMSASMAMASNNTVNPTPTIINPPSTNSFDIGWVEPSTGTYFLADRANNAVDMVNAATDTFLGYIAQGVFTGRGPSPCTAPGNSHACGGPNGVVTDSSHLVWAGDGNSTIKVLRPDPNTGAAALIKSIPTGGAFRADELSYDPRDQLILVANDAEGFLTFINVATQSVAGHFYYSDNTLGKPASVAGHATAGGGIEQSVWDPQTGLFYQAVPANSPQTTGFIDVFDPVSEKLVNSFPVPGCTNGPTGLALGPNQRFLGACENGAAAVEVHNGKVHAIVPDVGGADEIWFNPGDSNFYLAISAGKLGVVDANNDHVVQVVTGVGGHSVAAYAGNNHIFDPIAAGGGIDIFTSTKK